MRSLSQRAFNAFWDQKGPLNYALLPLSWLFRGAAFIRRAYYRANRSEFPVPIVIIGHISVGGVGKTPLVAHLAQALRLQNLNVGIILRGYKGTYATAIKEVDADSDPREVGDEAKLLFLKTQCPVMVAKKRTLAARELLKKYPNTNVILSDDGLQHYALARQVEIAVVDAKRQFGNGFCLPAGPLRESVKRLSTCDFVVWNVSDPSITPQDKYPWVMRNQLSADAVSLADYSNGTENRRTVPIEYFQGKTVHAVAGIGNPAKFFDALRAKGLNPIPHAFADHYAFCKQDFSWQKGDPILMTEKDAVKCQKLGLSNAWIIPLEISLAGGFTGALLRKINHGQKTA